MPSRTAHIDTLDQESVDPQHEQPASDLSSAPSKPRRSKRAAVVVEHASPTSAPTAEHAVTNKRRKRSASAPRTLSKEELADYIARGEFWQKCEAAEGEGDGYQDGRGDGGGDPVYEDCNEIRRKIAAFLNGGRMTQTAWCKLLGVGSSSYQHFMKARGPCGGSGNGVYPAAARFFESLRILEHKPKSAKRKKEEAAFGRYGRAAWTVPSAVWCKRGDYVVLDEVGRTRVIHNNRA